MVNLFKKKFGDKDNVAVCIGDWSQRLKKFHEPTKGIGFRKTFRRAGYKVRLIKIINFNFEYNYIIKFRYI
jgi:hypothetical protein